jgi:hypothetical protein
VTYNINCSLFAVCVMSILLYNVYIVILLFCSVLFCLIITILDPNAYCTSTAVIFSPLLLYILCNLWYIEMDCTLLSLSFFRSLFSVLFENCLTRFIHSIHSFFLSLLPLHVIFLYPIFEKYFFVACVCSVDRARHKKSFVGPERMNESNESTSSCSSYTLVPLWCVAPLKQTSFFWIFAPGDLSKILNKVPRGV